MANGIIRLDEGWHMDAGHHFDQPPNVPPLIVPPPAPTKPKGKTMDFIPNKRSELKEWLEGISDNIVAEAVKMGVSAPDGLAAKALADGLLAKFDATDAGQAALNGVRTIERNATPGVLAGLRTFIRNWKTLPLYAGSGSEGVLHLRGSSAAFDSSSYKPVIEASYEGGFISFDFDKLGVDALAFYCRLRGTLPWIRIGIDTLAPFLDSKPVAVNGVPEVREYMARGMVGDDEVGLDSDIVTVTLPG